MSCNKSLIFNIDLAIDELEKTPNAEKLSQLQVWMDVSTYAMMNLNISLKTKFIEQKSVSERFYKPLKIENLFQHYARAGFLFFKLARLPSITSV